MGISWDILELHGNLIRVFNGGILIGFQGDFSGILMNMMGL